jgi:hypothetical protein
MSFTAAIPRGGGASTDVYRPGGMPGRVDDGTRSARKQESADERLGTDGPQSTTPADPRDGGIASTMPIEPPQPILREGPGHNPPIDTTDPVGPAPPRGIGPDIDLEEFGPGPAKPPSNKAEPTSTPDLVDNQKAQETQATGSQNSDTPAWWDPFGFFTGGGDGSGTEGGPPTALLAVGGAALVYLLSQA